MKAVQIKKICENFSDMYFSYAYCGGAFPAPFTARICKVNGIKHPLQDVIVQSGKLECTECTSRIKRMEGLKGFVRKAENGKYEAVKPEYVLTTHTSVDYNSHTALDGSLYSVKAIKKGQKFIAVIDDCDSGMIYEGKIIYAGKFSSAGFGKMKISSITDAAEASSQSVIDSVEDFENRFKVKNKAALLFMSDALLDFGEISTNHTKEEYLKIWQNALFGAENAPILVEKVYAQTQIYSGYDTSKKWGEWKQKEPQLLVLKGTSVLLDISDREQAAGLLAKLENDGIGQKTKDGFGQIKVCHDIHKLGVGNDE